MQFSAILFLFLAFTAQATVVYLIPFAVRPVLADVQF